MTPIQLIAVAVCALVGTVSSQRCFQLTADVSRDPLEFLKNGGGKFIVYKSITAVDICDTYIYNDESKTERIISINGRQKNYYHLSVEKNKDLTKTDLMGTRTTIRSLHYHFTNTGSIKISYKCNSVGGFERLYVLVSSQAAIPLANAIILSKPGITELQHLIECRNFPKN